MSHSPMTIGIAGLLLSRAQVIRGEGPGDWAALEAAINENFPFIELAEDLLVKGKTLENALELVLKMGRERELENLREAVRRISSEGEK